MEEIGIFWLTTFRSLKFSCPIRNGIAPVPGISNEELKQVWKKLFESEIPSHSGLELYDLLLKCSSACIYFLSFDKYIFIG